MVYLLNVIIPSVSIVYIWVAEDSQLLATFFKMWLQRKILIGWYLLSEFDQRIVKLYSLVRRRFLVLIGNIDLLYFVGLLQAAELAWVYRKKAFFYPLHEVVEVVGAS